MNFNYDGLKRPLKMAAVGFGAASLVACSGHQTFEKPGEAMVRVGFLGGHDNSYLEQICSNEAELMKHNPEMKDMNGLQKLISADESLETCKDAVAKYTFDKEDTVKKIVNSNSNNSNFMKNHALYFPGLVGSNSTSDLKDLNQETDYLVATMPSEAVTYYGSLVAGNERLDKMGEMMSDAYFTDSIALTVDAYLFNALKTSKKPNSKTPSSNPESPFSNGSSGTRYIPNQF